MNVNFISSLYILLYGMLGVFGVIGFIAIFVFLLTKVFKAE